MNRLKQGLIGLSFLFFFFPAVSQAGGEPQLWHTLPQIENILFSKDAVGFVASDKRYFVFDRGSKEFHQVDESRMKETFPGPAPLPLSEAIRESGDHLTVRFRTSDGIEYRVTDGYCDEGQHQNHTLRRNDVYLKDAVSPCDSISAVEGVGDQLWLGTHYYGEDGESPGEGVIVQAAKKGTLIKKIGSGQGLTGELIRVIRTDPYGPAVWVATQQGVNQLDLNLNIVQSGFFYEDFDPATGISAIFLSPTFKKSNPLAILQRQLDDIEEMKSFYEVVKKIPQEVQKRFLLQERLIFLLGYGYPTGIQIKEAFAPKEMNALIPFFSKSIRYLAIMQTACIFNDPAILHAYRALEREGVEGGKAVPYFVSECLDKYSRMEEAFLNAFQGNRADLLARLMERGGSLEAIDADGMTGLMWAAKAGVLEAAQVLVGEGANVNAQNSRGETALIQAAKGGHARIAKLLLDAGADPKGGRADLSPDYRGEFSDYPLIVRLIKEGAACCGTLEEIGRQEEQEKQDLAEVEKFDPVDWDALQKGCRPRKEYAANIPPLVERQPGHAGLEIVTGASKENCPPESGCRLFTKLEFEKLSSRRIKNFTASTRLGIRPCMTKRDILVLTWEAEIEAIQRSQYNQDPLLRKRLEKTEGEWCSRSKTATYPEEVRIQFVLERGLMIGRGTEVPIIGKEGSQISVGGIHYFSLIPIGRVTDDTIEYAYVSRYGAGRPEPTAKRHIRKTEKGLQFDEMPWEPLTPSCDGFWKESPS